MVRIIPYTDNHKKATKEFILGVLNQEFGLSSTKRPDLDTISETYQQKKSNFWIAISNKIIVGSIAIKSYGKERGYLKRMYVDRRFRGKGLQNCLP